MMKVQKEKITYPRFLDNKPCGKDLFEGKSHDTIAQNIAKILQNNEANVIGIDGGWGSGKSNIIDIIKDKLDSNTFRFFVYDAWGHIEDLQRRSILEELTDFLTKPQENNPPVLSNKWKQKLKELLAKRREVETKSIPKLGWGIVAAVFALIGTPLFNIIAERLESERWQIIVACIPLALLILLVLWLFGKNLILNYKNGFCKCVSQTLSEAFSIYTDRQKEDTTFETISEDEPSSRKFKQWMHEIDNDVKNKTIIIVFDNMDRLPCQKVQELWSTIHTFFADESYKNIRVIVPFDREHIKNAFKDEDAENNAVENGHRQCFGNDFINKTFNVIYRVSPPVMSDWKAYFMILWKKAFGIDLETNSRVTQIYDLLSKNPTPREITAFINEFVSIKQVTGETIPDEYIALFIFGKTKINKDPFVEIITPTYLSEVKFLYQNDEELPKYISALYYQLPPERSLDIIYVDRLRKALDTNNASEVEQISKLNNFDKLLEQALPLVNQPKNAIIILNNHLDANCKKHWDCLYYKVQGNEDTLQEYQKILLQKITKKREYLRKVVKGFTSVQNLNPVQYSDSIQGLEKLEGIDPYGYIQQIAVQPEAFVAYVSHTQEDYRKYKIVCNREELDTYLAEKARMFSFLQSLTIIPIILEEYKELPSYRDTLVQLVKENATIKEVLTVVYSHLKEVERLISITPGDSAVYNMFVKSNENEPFYYDLLCMRLAKLDKLPAQFIAAYKSELNKTEEEFVKKVACEIEYYMSYGDVLLSADFCPLLKAVAIYITKHPNPDSMMNLVKVLQNYESIINTLNIDSEILLAQLNQWDAKMVEDEHIITLPVRFFEDAINEENRLTQRCISLCQKQLNEILVEQWEEEIKNKTRNYQLLIALRAKLQNAYEAFKNILTNIAKGECTIDKDDCHKMIRLAQQNRRSLISTFKNIRDIFCSGTAMMTSKIFDIIGEYLFTFGKLEENTESLRTILPLAILDKDYVIQLVLQSQDIVVAMFKKAGEYQTDFKDKIQSLLDNKYQDDQDFELFANAIGVYKAEEIEQKEVAKK